MRRRPKLTLLGRERIFWWLCEGKSHREIARLLGRSHTSINREIARNKNQWSGEYLPCVAEKKAYNREVKQRRKAPFKEPFILLYVKQKLRMGWSPETISGRSQLEYPNLDKPEPKREGLRAAE